MHKWIQELQMVWRKISSLNRSIYELYRDVNKNPDRLIIGIMSETEYLYWNEHIRDCKFLKKNGYSEEQWNMQMEKARKTYEKKTNV